MRTTRSSILLPILLVLLLPLVACQPSAEEDTGETFNEEEWAALKTAKQSVDEKRAEREALADELAAVEAGEAPEPAEGDEPAEGEEARTAEQIQAEIDALTGDIDDLTDQLAGGIPEFMNKYFEIPVDDMGRVDEAALTPVQKEAIEMKVEEDMVLAREYIVKGGEYEKAINIYQQSMVLAPSYQPLLDAKAEAEANQFMSEERFSQVAKKMTQDQVADLLGAVKRSNVREYPEKQILGWFYRKDDGGAAGVFFKEVNTGAGDWTVYSMDYEAVKPQVIGGDSGDAGDADETEPPPEG